MSEPTQSSQANQIAPVFPLVKLLILLMFSVLNISAFNDFSATTVLASSMSILLYMVIGFFLYPYLLIAILRDLDRLQGSHQTLAYHVSKIATLLIAGGMFLVNLILLMM